MCIKLENEGRNLAIAYDPLLGAPLGVFYLPYYHSTSSIIFPRITTCFHSNVNENGDALLILYLMHRERWISTDLVGNSKELDQGIWNVSSYIVRTQTKWRY